MRNLTDLNDKYRYIVTFDDKTLQQKNYEELYDQREDKDEMINLESIKSYKKISEEDKYF